MVIKTSITFLNADSDELLIKDTGRILAGMTGNAAYLKPSPDLVLIKAASDDFSTALAEAGDGGTTLTAIKNDKRQALCNLLRPLASYVDIACNSDLTILLSSGFPIQKPQRFPIGDLPAPANLKVTLGLHSGGLDASVTPVYGAATYNWKVVAATQPTVIVQTAQTTAASTVFAGLTPGVVYIIQANAVGAAGPSDWSSPVSQMVV